MTAQNRGPGRRPERSRVPSFDPMAVVDHVLRLLVAERVAVGIGSVERAVEDAARLLRTLGVAPTDLTPNTRYWMAYAEACRDQAESTLVDEPGQAVRPC